MQVYLAGYNVDLDLLNELKKQNPGFADKLTPETISAAYARISRDPRPINKLREVSRNEVEKAKKSNSMIIFEMGHSSIAEHVVFNFDIVGLSRLAIEELEHFRLASYTEKSQRYITLTDDFIVPTLFDEKDKIRFEQMINQQNLLYHEMFDKLKVAVFAKNKELAADPKNHRTLEGWVKEDARYVTSLATEGQLGLTVNARTLELMIQRFAASKLAEVSQLGQTMYEQVKNVAPSVVKYPDSTAYNLNSYANISGACNSFDCHLGGESTSVNNEVVLLDHTVDLDDKVLAAVLHTTSNLSYVEILAKVKILNDKEKQTILKKGFKDIKLYNSMLREFEFVDFTFELNISAACFGQLKRHRLCSMISQPYDLNCGLKIPQVIKEIGYLDKFMDIAKQTKEIYRYLKEKYGNSSAEYILLNAHRRRVLIKINARELYHLSRLREDVHAQWDIREVTVQMVEQAKKVAPLTLFLIGGKDRFQEIYNKVYS
ncbi:MAG: FAD-dependent thymidylate synthase [bacterium]|nr:FAD-dependent thymidylate synthase [bacterium]